ncbi:MAG: short-chain dehydrogenase [Saprospiraceae bacterium]|nr:MAG: short-chain dehydrogenase [Saprospiraceae bacterium]
MEKLNNKVALITGASKGIGLGIAEAMVRQGMKVAITSRHQKEVDEAAEKLNQMGPGEAIGLRSDVANFSDEQAVVDLVVKQWGQLDVLIANAGVGHFAPIEDLSVDQWKTTIDTNLTGVFHSVKAALPSLKKSEGYIITIASLAGTNFFANGAAYNASKFGLVGFTQAIMLDLRHHGIKVSTIMPGSVATYFNNHEPNEADAWKIQPEDLGQMVIDLLKMPARTLPSKVEVRPSQPPRK